MEGVEAGGRGLKPGGYIKFILWDALFHNIQILC